MSAEPEPLPNFTPRELARRLAAGERWVLLDVREPFECAIASLPGSTFVPLGELARRVVELEPEAATVCICHHGLRSARAAAWLSAQGFRQVANLSGGIDRWAEELDPALARY